jgi:hypothetical protein
LQVALHNERDEMNRSITTVQHFAVTNACFLVTIAAIPVWSSISLFHLIWHLKQQKLVITNLLELFCTIKSNATFFNDHVICKELLKLKTKGFPYLIRKMIKVDHETSVHIRGIQ